MLATALFSYFDHRFGASERTYRQRQRVVQRIGHRVNGNLCEQQDRSYNASVAKFNAFIDESDG
jgi:hypothetical protein